MSEPVVVQKPCERIVDGWRELSAEVDGDRIWFAVPSDTKLALRAEPFVAAGLLEAMIRGVPLVVEAGIPLSPVLYQQLEEIQSIYKCWNTDLSHVEISADLSEAACIADSVASFYSGGVDSSHTLLTHREELDTLIFLLGFDGGTSDHDWEKRLVEHREFADRVGKKLITIKTNARQFAFDRRIDWSFGYGLCLATLGPMLQLSKVFIPSGHTYSELFPEGSHPLSDPMWSTGVNRVIHDGSGFRRSEKMSDLREDQMILDNLQVCWRSSSRNCGACPKCVRTMVALHLLDAKCKKLPPLSNMELLSWLKTNDESNATFLEDAIVLARRQGNVVISKKLKSYYRRYQWGQVIPLLDRTLLGGILRRIYRRLRKPDWLNERVSLRAKDRWV
jgi:hypothetical protein